MDVGNTMTDIRPMFIYRFSRFMGHTSNRKNSDERHKILKLIRNEIGNQEYHGDHEMFAMIDPFVNLEFHISEEQEEREFRVIAKYVLSCTEDKAVDELYNKFNNFLKDYACPPKQQTRLCLLM